MIYKKDVTSLFKGIDYSKIGLARLIEFEKYYPKQKHSVTLQILRLKK